MFRWILPRILFLIILIPWSAIAQTPTGSPQITEKEKAELRDFTKEFLAQLRRTRDVRPLLATYFAKDYEAFVYLYLLADSAPKSSKHPSLRDRRRLVINTLQYAAVLSPYTVLGQDFEKEFPPSLRRSFKRLVSSIDSVDDADETWETQIQFLPQAEAFFRVMSAHLRRHPLERTAKYKAAVAKREKIDDYNYSISVDVPESDGDHRAAKWIRSQPKARTYMVGTPAGLAVGIIHAGGKYKVLYVLPWPMSYDGRLSN